MKIVKIQSRKRSPCESCADDLKSLSFKLPTLVSSDELLLPVCHIEVVVMPCLDSLVVPLIEAVVLKILVFEIIVPSIYVFLPLPFPTETALD